MSGEVDMAEVDDFLGAMLPTIHEMDRAFINGDVGPRTATWSHSDPVTLFGALLTKSGWAEIGPAFEFLASRFSDGTEYEYKVTAAGASGDLAYIVGIEHTKAAVGGATPEAFELRVTTIFRREDGEWRIVHRHADPAPDSDAARRQLTRF
jgi:ketosteroid isomerase-like protein